MGYISIGDITGLSSFV